MDHESPLPPEPVEEFPAIPQPEGKVPDDFDETCVCGKELVRKHVVCRTRRRPFAVFGCEECSRHLYLFDAPRIPLIVSFDKFPHSLGSAYFSEFIDELIEKREAQHKRNQERAKRSQR